MRWFKHKSDARLNAKLIAVRHQYGFEGIGRFWTIVEIVANGARKEAFEVTLPLAEWCSFLAAKPKQLRTYLTDLQNLRLWYVEETGSVLKIRIPNLAKHKDEYARKSGQAEAPCPDKLPPEPESESRHRELNNKPQPVSAARARAETPSGSGQGDKPLGKKKATAAALERVQNTIGKQQQAVDDLLDDDPALAISVREAFGSWQELEQAFDEDRHDARRRFRQAFGRTCAARSNRERGSPDNRRSGTQQGSVNGHV